LTRFSPGLHVLHGGSIGEPSYADLQTVQVVLPTPLNHRLKSSSFFQLPPALSYPLQQALHEIFQSAQRTNQTHEEP